jgi:hypothetical protein
MTSEQSAVLAGVVPIAPTPFRENGDLDLDSQRRVLDCMIEQGVDGICILANYSEQFLLSDDERKHAAGRVHRPRSGALPVIVTCSHFSIRIAADRARRAVAAGVQMLMLMPPYHGALLRASSTSILPGSRKPHLFVVPHPPMKSGEHCSRLRRLSATRYVTTEPPLPVSDPTFECLEISILTVASSLEETPPTVSA